MGRGGISRVARAAQTERATIRRGITELERGQAYVEGDRVREKGGGRKSLSSQDPTLVADLEALLDPKGDPMSLLKWTTKSITHLQQALQEQGHRVAETTVRRLLQAQGYTLQANRKEHEGATDPDRDGQFTHIKEACAAFEGQGQPIISVDCKKKELLGNFKNQGREWQPKGQPVAVNVYDFLSLAEGKAIPYGVYDVLQNTGFVNVGQDHDTAAFAVESIRRWWRHHGQDQYGSARELLIVADGGGSNSTRGRLWKRELQALANDTGLTLRVAHLPPGTSKWNKIEHKLFSYISINWRARPLTSMETVIELISSTTTASGLTVTAVVDANTYPTKIAVSKAEIAALHLLRDAFHGDWNYAILPQ
jgi:Rhodopirellula transposase DDE domain